MNEIKDLEGTEVSDAWSRLIDLHESFGCYISNELKDMIVRELIIDAEHYKKYFKIEEKTVTNTFTIRELVEIIPEGETK